LSCNVFLFSINSPPIHPSLPKYTRVEACLGIT